MRQVYTYASRTVNGETLSSDRIESVATIVGGVTDTLSYTYDGNGNIKTISKNGTKISEYIYDDLDELTCEYDYANGKKFVYQYDERGNIVATVKLSLSFDSNNEEVTEFESVTTAGYSSSSWSDLGTYYNGSGVTYDASGNPTSFDGASLQWENGRRLKSYSKGAVSVNYTYDSNGIRVSKYSSNSEVYTGENRDYTIVDGRITSEYVSGGMSIASYDYRVYYRYDKNGSPIGFDLIKNGTTSTYTYVKNIQGDIVGILNDSTRRRVVTYTYDAWGKITSVTGTDAETVGKYNSLRYRGYYYDEESEYYYLQSRYYDPGYKRFINADEPTLITELAKASVLGGNLFAYCENNAVMGYDPTGKWLIDFLPGHKQLCKDAGIDLGSRFFVWDRYADDFYNSNTHYSAPFHCQNAWDIIEDLYNIAMKLKLKKNRDKVVFSYNTKDTGRYILPKTLLFDEKSHKCNNRDSKTGKCNETIDISNRFINRLNGLPDCRAQSRALIGLALHTAQDFYAHKIQISAIGILVSNNRKAGSYSGSLSGFNHFLGVDTKKIEDNPDFMSWRYQYALADTKMIIRLYNRV